MRLRSVAISGALLLGLALLRIASLSRWPDDWDGIGFVESIRRFDLDRFMPHAPGYPVYVALLRAAALVLHDPIAAANAVAVASGLAATLFVGVAGRRALGSEEGALWLVGFTALAPLAWRSSTAIGSEAPALALACGALASAATRGRGAAWGIGLAVGLGLGVRVSWAPLYLPFLLLAAPGERIRATLVALGATVAWLIPFVAFVGPSHLVRLATTHASGHFSTWGGTTVSEPGPMRLAYFARDIFVDGIGVGRDPLGVAIGAGGLILLALGLRAWRRHGWPHVRVALVVVPYALWIAFGQNLRQQPRHALPLVVVVAASMALAAACSSRARAVGGVLLTLVALRSLQDASSRKAIAPPGAQLVALVSALPESSGAAVFAGPSARFFELSDSHVIAQTVGTLGDVRLALGRLPSLPRKVIVTSELQGLDASRAELLPLASFCRPDRIERRAPCVDAYEWRLPFLVPR